MFRKPSEGQSLISYLSEQDFGSCADLEKVRALTPSDQSRADWSITNLEKIWLFTIFTQIHAVQSDLQIQNSSVKDPLW